MDREAVWSEARRLDSHTRCWGECWGDWGQRPSDSAPCWRKSWWDWACDQDLPPRLIPSSALALLRRPASLTRGGLCCSRSAKCWLHSGVTQKAGPVGEEGVAGVQQKGL